jgi:hypothetical protein
MNTADEEGKTRVLENTVYPQPVAHVPGEDEEEEEEDEEDDPEDEEDPVDEEDLDPVDDEDPLDVDDDECEVVEPLDVLDPELVLDFELSGFELLLEEEEEWFSDADVEDDDFEAPAASAWITALVDDVAGVDELVTADSARPARLVWRRIRALRAEMESNFIDFATTMRLMVLPLSVVKMALTENGHFRSDGLGFQRWDEKVNADKEIFEA